MLLRNVFHVQGSEFIVVRPLFLCGFEAQEQFCCLLREYIVSDEEASNLCWYDSFDEDGHSLVDFLSVVGVLFKKKKKLIPLLFPILLNNKAVYFRLGGEEDVEPEC